MEKLNKNDENTQNVFRRRYSEHGKKVNSVCSHLECNQRLPGRLMRRNRMGKWRGW